MRELYKKFDSKKLDEVLSKLNKIDVQPKVDEYNLYVSVLDSPLYRYDICANWIKKALKTCKVMQFFATLIEKPYKTN